MDPFGVFVGFGFGQCCVDVDVAFELDPGSFVCAWRVDNAVVVCLCEFVGCWAGSHEAYGFECFCEVVAWFEWGDESFVEAYDVGGCGVVHVLIIQGWLRMSTFNFGFLRKKQKAPTLAVRVGAVALAAMRFCA